MLIFNPFVFSQNDNTNYEIYLKSRRFTPNVGMSDSATNLLESSKSANIKTYLIMQFNDNLDSKTKKELEQKGINFLSYLPEKAWFVSVPPNIENYLISSEHIRATETINSEDKISPYLRDERIGSWAISEKGKIILLVHFFKDTSLAEGLNIIKNHEGDLLYFNKPLNALAINLPKDALMDLSKENIVQWIEQIPPPFDEQINSASQTLGINTVHNNPYNLTGVGVQAIVYDSGLIYEHVDLNDRIIWSEKNRRRTRHATLVAGILGGAGTNSSGLLKGVAPEIQFISYKPDDVGFYYLYNDTGDMESDFSEAIQTYHADLASMSVGVLVSMNFYDCNWLGDYESTSQFIDNVVRGNLSESIHFFKAVGNERNLLGPHKDCGDNYNTISPPSAAKNIISVGATEDDDDMTYFSSWGPTDDGRIKPDLVAQGLDINSTTNNTYGYYEDSGSSFATPFVSGIASLMLQQFTCSQPYGIIDPLPSTIKAILIQTAEDLNNTGPDYVTGWGRVNATEAVDWTIYRYFREETLSDTNDEDVFNFTINDSSEPVKVTLVWDDFPATPNNNKTLINDIDLYLKAPNGSIIKSWILDPDNPATAATKDGNNIDNVEQVYVASPGSDNLYDDGVWQIIVNSSKCPKCPQNYSLAYKRPFTLTLYNNWNLISIPIMPYNATFESIFGDDAKDDIESVWWFNASGAEWLSWFSGNETEDTLNELTPGMGVWINKNSSGNMDLEINGGPAFENSESSSGYTTELVGNSWNYLGSESFFNIPVEEVISSLNYSEVWMGQADKQYGDPDFWLGYTSNNSFENVNFDIRPGLAIFIYMNEDENWTQSHSRSCPSTFEYEQYNASEREFSDAYVYEATDLTEMSVSSKNTPYVVYGYATCDNQLNETSLNITISLEVNGSVLDNYTMGDLPIDQFRVQVPMGGDGGASVNDTAEIFINNVSIVEGNITIGSSGDYYYFNISINQTTDSDGDNYSDECLDCNDNNASINPDANETCTDSVDNDCDGLTDCDDPECDSVYDCLQDTGEACYADTDCKSNRCDNDGLGLSDDMWCYNITNSTLDGEDLYCERDIGTNVSDDCDERQPNATLDECIGLTYYEDECTSACMLQDITTVFECNETNCACDESECDGKSGGSNITTCASGETYFADKCNATAGGEDRGDNICRSSAFATGCTADSDCNGIEAGTGNYCTSNCTYSPANITISSFLQLDSNGSKKIFEFIVENDGGPVLNNVTWQFNSGTGQTINNTQNISLSSGENVFVFLETNYTTKGLHTVVANTTPNNYNISASKDLTVGVGLVVWNMSELYTLTSNTILEIVIINYGAALTNINWSIKPGNYSTINSTQSFNLTDNEELFLYFNQNYSVGTHLVNASSTDGSNSHWHNITINVSS